MQRYSFSLPDLSLYTLFQEREVHQKQVEEFEQWKAKEQEKLEVARLCTTTKQFFLCLCSLLSCAGILLIFANCFKKQNNNQFLIVLVKCQLLTKQLNLLSVKCIESKIFQKKEYVPIIMYMEIILTLISNIITMYKHTLCAVGVACLQGAHTVRAESSTTRESRARKGNTSYCVCVYCIVTA